MRNAVFFLEMTALNNGLNMPLLGFGVFQITNQKQCEERSDKRNFFRKRF